MRPPARALLRKLAALPALVSSGWARPLSVPLVAQLGYYPPGARYQPHLDRSPTEPLNRKELTFLLYANVDWDVSSGGELRVHPPAAATPPRPDLPLAPQEVVDIAPLAGRVVIFQSAHVLHEVRPCTGARGRLALTLWVEYA